MAPRLDPHRSLAGLAAAAVALGVAALLAIPLGPHADSRTAVGSVVIDLTPGPVKEWAIQTFATNDKLFLTVAVILAIAVIAMVTAQFEDRKLGSIAIGLAGVLGGAAVLSRTGARPIDVVPSLVGAAAGIAVLRVLVSERLDPRVPEPDADTGAADPGRRQSLAALGFLAAGTLAGVIGTVLGRAASSVSGDRSAYTPPAPKIPGPPIPPDV